ncbi:MAG: phosphomannomutase/phosphoglucomutase [Bdellovibrionota bacterium]
MISKLFREYDIRGIADTELTSPFAWSLGRALADLLSSEDEKNCYICEDVRLSSPRLAENLASGLEAGGIKVQRLNPGPTPILYFAAHESTADFKTQSGVMITGSHNPAEFNGFKMVIKGKAIYGESIQALLAPVQKYLQQVPTSPTSTAKKVDREEDYIHFLKGNLKIKNPSEIKVVLDAGNGAAGPLAVKAYTRLGLQVVPLFCDFDGSFPNHHPDPTVPKNLVALQEKVANEKAQLGIAYDGDGDRIGVVSAEGKILYGDQILLYLSRALLKEVPGAKIISEVKSSQLLYDELARLGAKPIIWKTGHSLIKAKLKETGAELAGEMSGHIFFQNRFFGYDDALYAGLRFIEALSLDSESVDAFMEKLPKVYNTPEIRSDCPDEEKFAVVEKFVALAKKEYGSENVLDIDGARIKFPGLGWGLLRASNTQPVIVMRFEGVTAEALAQVKSSIAALLATISTSVKVPE